MNLDGSSKGLSGGYADLSLQDGFLVEAGRASCCAWGYSIYRPTAKRYPINESNQLYDILIDSAVADETKPECTFQGKVRGRWQIIKPLTKKLRSRLHLGAARR